jgi:hypothetical protein
VTIRRALAVLVAMFALAACRVDTTVHVAVQPNGSGTITVTAVADKELVDRTPGLAKDLRFDDAIAAGWQVDGPTSTSDGGLQVSVSHAFSTPAEATTLLGSLNGSDGPLHGITVTRSVSGGKVTTGLTGQLRIANGLDAFADPDVLAAIGGSPYANDLAASKLKPADVLTFTFSAELPGVVRGGANTPAGTASPVNGSVPARAVSWAVPLDGSTADVATTSVLNTGSSGAWGTLATAALIGLVVWTVLAVGFILFVAKARHDRELRQGGPDTQPIPRIPTPDRTGPVDRTGRLDRTGPIDPLVGRMPADDRDDLDDLDLD